MTKKQVRAIALSFDGAEEKPHFDRTSFRVKNKIFATMTVDGLEAMVKVPLEMVDDYLEEADIFFAYGKWTTNHGSIGVRLKKISVKRMRALLAASYAKTKS